MKKRFILLFFILAAALGALYATGELEGLIDRFREKDPNRIRLYGNVEIRQVLLGFRVSGRIEAIGARGLPADRLICLPRAPADRAEFRRASSILRSADQRQPVDLRVDRGPSNARRHSGRGRSRTSQRKELLLS